MNARELWESSAAAWIASVGEGDSSRLLILDEPMLRLAGDVTGLDVCDVGCGEGRFCRMLRARGARTVGIDPTSSLISAAHKKDSESRYVIADAEALPLANDSFDLVISYLVLLDIDDFRKAIQEMARITKPGGRILVCNMNSFISTRETAWVRDSEDKLLHVAVDNYFEERSMVVGWKGIEIVNYHRPFEAYIGPFLKLGLRLINFEEPKPTLEAVESHPGVASGLRVPFFHCMQWKKEPLIAGR